MLKNIIIVSHAMEIGGAERALVGLLNSIDYDNYNVDLFLFHHCGELMKYIPEKVNLLPENPKYASLAVPFSQVIKNRAFAVGFGRYIGNKKAEKYFEKTGKSFDGHAFITYSHKYTKAFMPKISDKNYDLAISFLTPHYFVAEKINAKKKIAWVHTDYSSIETDFEEELKMWQPYDKIIAVSPMAAEAFVSRFPSLESKMESIENIHPAKLIKAQADEIDVSDEMPDDGYIKFLSVGRFCVAKNFDNVPDICSRLENVKWYIIGFGGEEELYRSKIKEAGMEDRVIILGKKENPYPYIKRCDFYLQPSRYEGNAVTVNEALILGKKVVITNYATATSQIKNGVDGVIVPLENEKCAKGIADFLADEELQKNIEEFVKKSDYSKSDEINKIYRIVGNV